MTKTNRILISINTSWNIYNFRASLIHALKEQGYEVLTAAPDDNYSDRLRTMVDEHYPISMSNDGTSPIQDFLLFCRYVRMLRKAKPSVMLSYTVKPNIYGSFACGLLRIPIINNVSGLGTVFIKRNWITWVATTLYRHAFKFSSHVFFQNEEDHETFIREKLVDPSKTELIPGSGIDLEHYQPRPAPHNSALSFILIARMLRDKGVGEYVEAARIVKQRYPEVKFKLLGPTGIANKTAISAEEIQHWTEEGIIEYLGESDDIREIMAQNDAVVLPSYREGMSRVLLEGLAMGRPLIATNVPGCKQTVEEGKNGFLCRLKDADHLAEKLIAFIELSDAQRLEMGKASRCKAENEFDQKIVINAYLDQIKSLL